MRSIGKRLSLAAIVGVAALAGTATSAQAAFDSDHNTVCENAESITGVGASFQRDAQRAWGAEIFGTGTPFPAEARGWAYSFPSCAAFKLPADGGNRTFRYNPAGSGAGRTAMGANGTVCAPRDTTVDWAGVDEAPSTQQITNANQGTGCSRQSATLHTVPIGQGSIAVAVQLPNGCEVATSAARQLSRLKTEGAFAADSDYDTWGELFGSNMKASSGGGQTDTSCRAKQFKRVVRLDNSGTTFQLKKYFAAVVGLEGGASSGTNWDEAVLPNNQWPNDSGATTVVRGAANGNGPLLDALALQTTNGGIGYGDLGTARGKGYGWNYTGGVLNPDDRQFFPRIQRIADNQYISPAKVVDAAATTLQKGANCVDASYANTPASTTGSWESATAVNTTVAYPICTLTYTLIFQNASKVPTTQGRHRAAKDYLLYILRTTSGGGQLVLNGFDYTSLPDTLPASILTKARAGQSALTWG